MATSHRCSQLANNRIDTYAFGFSAEVRDEAVASSMLGVKRTVCVYVYLRHRMTTEYRDFSNCIYDIYCHNTESPWSFDCVGVAYRKS
jgi:hypothetical protein